MFTLTNIKELRGESTNYGIKDNLKGYFSLIILAPS